MNRRNFQVIGISAIAAIGGLLFGFDTGVISGAQPFLQHKDGWAVTDSMLELITTAVLLGAIIGALVSGRLSDLYGRKKIIIVTSLIFLAGSLFTGAASSPTTLIVGRVIIGLAIGIASFAVPLYISEISPASIRGALVTLNQLMITIGIVVSYITDYLLANEADPFCWRPMFYIGFVPSVILFAGMFFLPESPRWLVARGRIDEAEAVLRQVENPEEVEENLRSIQADLAIDTSGQGWSGVFKPWLRVALFIGMGIFVVQQFVGINTVIYYSPKIFLLAGFEGAKGAIAAAITMGLFNVLFTVFSIFMLDRIGRRKLFFTGLTGILISLLLLGIAFYMQQQLGSALKWLTMGSLILYICFFAMSLGPLGWLLNAEIFPLNVRGVGVSLGAFSHWLFNAIVAFTFLKIAWWFTAPGHEIISAEGVIGPNPAGAFLLYAGVALLGIIWGYFFIPETKGKSLEHIEEHWRQGKSPRAL